MVWPKVKGVLVTSRRIADRMKQNRNWNVNRLVREGRPTILFRIMGATQ
jgi:hypothetical protein